MSRNFTAVNRFQYRNRYDTFAFTRDSKRVILIIHLVGYMSVLCELSFISCMLEPQLGFYFFFILAQIRQYMKGQIDAPKCDGISYHI